MPELKPITDFEAIVTKVQTMNDGPRVWLDLQEYATDTAAILTDLRYGDRYLRVVIYDEKEFQKAVNEQN